MGAEGSKPEGGPAQAFNPYNHVHIIPPALEVVRPVTPSAVTRPGTARREGFISEGGSGHISEAKRRLLDRSNESAWLQHGQMRGSAADVRSPRFPSASTRQRAQPQRPTLESQMGALLKVESLSPEQSLEQVIEHKKTEFIGKLNSFMSNGVTKLPTEMAMPKMAVLPPNKPKVSLKLKANWSEKLSNSKLEAMDTLKGHGGLEKPMYEPLTQENLGQEVEKSLGTALPTFAGYQGTLSHTIEQGLGQDLLDQFKIMDEESEKQLSTYEKWAVIRNAAEQVLQVYANRSNSEWLEKEQWVAPTVIDTNQGVGTVYSTSVDSALSQGMVALLFLDDGRLTETSPTEISALLSTDMWQAIKELAPQKVPCSHRLERLSMLGRHLLHAAISIEMSYGAAALKGLKVVVAVDCEQEHFLLSELRAWTFFGFTPCNVVILPLPRFHGFVQDMKRNTLAHVKGSPRLMIGTGYSLFLLNSPAEAYTLDMTGPSAQPHVLPGTVLDWLRAERAVWLFSGLFSDVERLRPDAMLDAQFLAGAMYGADRLDCNMAVEVVPRTSERDVRSSDSIVLGRNQADGTFGGNCVLRASTMRTVRSHQIISSHINGSERSYVSTQRYAFKVSGLQRLLVDAAKFHADVQLYGFYAYAMLDMSDLTTFADAKCMAVVGKGLPGPQMNEVVFTRQWLSYAAGILEAQDKVSEFRQKAIQLYNHDKHADNKVAVQHGGPGGSGSLGLSLSGSLAAAHEGHDHDRVSTFKERKTGLTVVMVLAPEHKAMASSTLNLARLFINNIVDRLHVVLLMGANDSNESIKAVMEEVTDKELEFNGQLTREVIHRNAEDRVVITDTVMNVLLRENAGLLVVPSLKLCETGHGGLGAQGMSLAFSIAKAIVTVPLLIVKANTAGRFHSPNPAVANSPLARDSVLAMIHLENTRVASLVEVVCKALTAGDVLFLAKTTAYEKPGLLSIRSRRMFVQARMSVVPGIKVEERAYAGAALQELSKAVEAETVDVLFTSVAGEMHLSKDQEELIKTCKSSIYIYRAQNEATANPIKLNILEPEPVPEGYSYKK